MKIYFTASVAAKQDHEDLTDRYEKIVKKLQDLGHEVMSDHVLKLEHNFITGVDDEFRVKYYREMLDKINRADLIFAEVSYSSASIGHEISVALDKNKPVILVSEEGRMPQIYKAMRDYDIYCVEYKNVDDLLLSLDEEIQNVKEGEDIRFNFLIPPSMVDYLEWVSKTRRIPKSVFIRDLVKREMQSDDGYQNR